MVETIARQGIQPMLRTRNVQPSLWESVLPEICLRLPAELERVDVWLDDERFFAPFVPFFDPRIGRPSVPMETYLRLMFLKRRYRLGYELSTPPTRVCWPTRWPGSDGWSGGSRPPVAPAAPRFGTGPARPVSGCELSRPSCGCVAPRPTRRGGPSHGATGDRAVGRYRR